MEQRRLERKDDADNSGTSDEDSSSSSSSGEDTENSSTSSTSSTSASETDELSKKDNDSEHKRKEPASTFDTTGVPKSSSSQLDWGEAGLQMVIPQSSSSNQSLWRFRTPPVFDEANNLLLGNSGTDAQEHLSIDRPFSDNCPLYLDLSDGEELASADNRPHSMQDQSITSSSGNKTADESSSDSGTSLVESVDSTLTTPRSGKREEIIEQSGLQQKDDKQKKSRKETVENLGSDMSDKNIDYDDEDKLSEYFEHMQLLTININDKDDNSKKGRSSTVSPNSRYRNASTDSWNRPNPFLLHYNDNYNEDDIYNENNNDNEPNLFRFEYNDNADEDNTIGNSEMSANSLHYYYNVNTHDNNNDIQYDVNDNAEINDGQDNYDDNLVENNNNNIRNNEDNQYDNAGPSPVQHYYNDNGIQNETNGNIEDIQYDYNNSVQEYYNNDVIESNNHIEHYEERDNTVEPEYNYNDNNFELNLNEINIERENNSGNNEGRSTPVEHEFRHSIGLNPVQNNLNQVDIQNNRNVENNEETADNNNTEALSPQQLHNNATENSINDDNTIYSILYNDNGAESFSINDDNNIIDILYSAEEHFLNGVGFENSDNDDDLLEFFNTFNIEGNNGRHNENTSNPLQLNDNEYVAESNNLNGMHNKYEQNTREPNNLAQNDNSANTNVEGLLQFDNNISVADNRDTILDRTHDDQIHNTNDINQNSKDKDITIDKTSNDPNNTSNETDSTFRGPEMSLTKDVVMKILSCEEKGDKASDKEIDEIKNPTEGKTMKEIMQYESEIIEPYLRRKCSVRYFGDFQTVPDEGTNQKLIGLRMKKNKPFDFYEPTSDEFMKKACKILEEVIAKREGRPIQNDVEISSSQVLLPPYYRPKNVHLQLIYTEPIKVDLEQFLEMRKEKNLESVSLYADDPTLPPMEQPWARASVHFCENCANLTYPKEDKVNRVLMRVCRNCNWRCLSPTICIYEHQLMKFKDNLRHIPPTVSIDPSLPRIQAECPECTKTTITYIMKETNRFDKQLQCYFICCNSECRYRWTIH